MEFYRWTTIIFAFQVVLTQRRLHYIYTVQGDMTGARATKVSVVAAVVAICAALMDLFFPNTVF